MTSYYCINILSIVPYSFDIPQINSLLLVKSFLDSGRILSRAGTWKKIDKICVIFYLGFNCRNMFTFT